MHNSLPDRHHLHHRGGQLLARHLQRLLGQHQPTDGGFVPVRFHSLDVRLVEVDQRNAMDDRRPGQLLLRLSRLPQVLFALHLALSHRIHRLLFRLRYDCKLFTANHVLENYSSLTFKFPLSASKKWKLNGKIT